MGNEREQIAGLDVMRLRLIGRLNYQEDLIDGEDGPSFIGPLEDLDERREVRRERLDDSDDEIVFLEEQRIEREMINERWIQRWSIFNQGDLVMVRVVYEGGGR